MREDEPTTLWEALEEHYLQTSESARKALSHSNIVVQTRNALLAPGVIKEDICHCTSHSVPPNALPVRPLNSWKAFVLQHFSSIWLDRSISSIRRHCNDLRSFNNTVKVVRQFFSFGSHGIPPRFTNWPHRVLQMELELYEQRVKVAQRLGKIESSRLLDEWTAIGAGLTNTFRQEIEAVLDNLRKNVPKRAPRKQERSKSVKRRKSRTAQPYRSLLKKHIRTALTDNPTLSDQEVCGAVEEEGIDEKAIPPAWRKGGDRGLTDMYRKDKSTRHKISSMISGVRRDLGIRRR